MKRKIISACAIVFSITAMTAQEKKSTNEFNRWSIDLNGGTSMPVKPLDAGFYSDNLNFNHYDLGARYMLNPKFGLKADFGYDNMKSGSKSSDFDTKFYRTDLQGVLNLGRICNFESWTRVINLQNHAGIGSSWMTNNNFGSSRAMLNFIVGLTGQVKVSNRIAINADFSVIKNFAQNESFNGTPTAYTDKVPNGMIYNATVGLSYYIGKQKVHADWYSEKNDSSKETEDLNSKIDQLESRLSDTENKCNDAAKKLIDTDRDGVADYLDAEQNTPAGALVDTKGRAIDHNNNKVPDEVENYIKENTKHHEEPKPSTSEPTSSVSKEDFKVYFNSGSAKPTKESQSRINVAAAHLKANPSATAEINGYSDNIGNADSNEVLSQKRANDVKNILVKSGVKSSRLSAKGKGVYPKAEEADKMRHVSIEIK